MPELRRNAVVRVGTKVQVKEVMPTLKTYVMPTFSLFFYENHFSCILYWDVNSLSATIMCTEKALDQVSEW